MFVRHSTKTIGTTALFAVLLASANAQSRSVNGFYWPLVNFTYSSAGSWYHINYLGNGTTHIGIDMMAAERTPVYAIADGTCILVQADGDPQSHNNMAVFVKHVDDFKRPFSSLYMHIKPVVAKNAHIKAGQLIGTIGINDNGNHLHFGIFTGDNMTPYGAGYPLNGWGRVPNPPPTNRNGFDNPRYWVEKFSPDGFTDEIGRGSTHRGAFLQVFHDFGGHEIFEKAQGNVRTWGPSNTQVEVQDFTWQGQGARQLIYNGQVVCAVYGAIGAVYNAANGPYGAFGKPLCSEVDCMNRTGIMGRMNGFQGGDIIWNRVNAYGVMGSIRNKYNQPGSAKGTLGFPTCQQSSYPTSKWGSKGVMSGFEGGDILSSIRGTYPIIGAMRDKYNADG